MQIAGPPPTGLPEPWCPESGHARFLGGRGAATRSGYPTLPPPAGALAGLNGTKPVTFLARWSADKAMQQARDRIRELTRRSRLLLAPEWIVEDLNQFLSGWAAYFFRFGNSAARFGKIRSYSRMRLALFISKRHRRSRAFGWSVVTYQFPDQLGLITLSGIVVDPRPFRDWRGRPNAGGERRR